MSEHKYRVWSEKHKKMVYFTLQELLLSYNDEYDYSSIAKSALFEIHQDINSDDGMQFTGLKDKSGKDIYEGDIVACGFDKAHVHCVVRIGNAEISVDTNEYSYTKPYYGVYLDYGYDLEEELLNGEMYILGNIYENPELIGKEEK